MINRRNMLKGLGLLFLPSVIDSKRIKISRSEQVIKWEGTLVFEQPMTWDQFCVGILDTLDTQVTDRIRDGLKEQGRLLKSETKFSGKAVQWVYYFRDRDSLQYWIQETGSKAFRDGFTHGNLTSQTTAVSKFEINMDTPELVIS